MPFLMKRPTLHDDDLVVEFDPMVIERIIMYIRHMGFDSANQRKRRTKDALPFGIYQKKDGTFFYTFKDISGK